MRLRRVRVPRFHLLAKLQHVTEAGKYVVTAGGGAAGESAAIVL